MVRKRRGEGKSAADTGRKKKSEAKRGREGRKSTFVHQMLSRPVKEADRIEFKQTLEKFRGSSEAEHCFQATLTNDERAVIHGMCWRMGLTSQSRGKAPNRVLCITKCSKKPMKEPWAYKLPVSQKSKKIFQKHFQAFPVNAQEEMMIRKPVEAPLESVPDSTFPGRLTICESGTSGSESSVKNLKPKRKKFRGPCASKFSATAVSSKLAALKETRRKVHLRDLESHRSKLPVAKHRKEILKAIAGGQVMMISGETGSGKTTQVPQYILEDCWTRGEPCRVLCTQPRRLSAVTVAERVAQEMGEEVGHNVGYKIRLESKGGLQSSLMFCTNGVLLRMMTQGSDISRELTHIIVDEIHERDSYSDFLLILLKDILPTNPSLKVILMSATLHEELFQDYFDVCPVVHVQGRTFPVEDFYLEDILRLTGYEDEALSNGDVALPPEKQPYCTSEEREAFESALQHAFVTGSDEAFESLTRAVEAGENEDGRLLNLQHSATGVTALSATVAHGRMCEMQVYLSKGADPCIPAKNGKTAIDFANVFNHQEIAKVLQQHAEDREQKLSDYIASSVLEHYHSNTNPEDVDLGLVERLLMLICGEGPWSSGGSHEDSMVGPGAILVFLPGWDDIHQLKLRLEKNSRFGGSRYEVLPLHSQLPSSEQRRAFRRPPPEKRKIILATNIAETSVTIEDVTVVINSGRLKHKSHDPYSGVSSLTSGWTAKSNERQRRGRAGRCQPGVAFHMYSTARGESFNEFIEPELKRTSLVEICLLVKMVCREHGGSIADFLAKAPDPPISESVTSAINLLKDIGALDDDEKLTLLGRQLGTLPVDPKLGKMLLYGILLKCLDPILTVACSMEYRDPWVLPMDRKEDARIIRNKFGNLYSGNSDHLSTVAAFAAFKNVYGPARKRFCDKNYLSHATMLMIEGMKEQLRGLLADLGLVERDSRMRGPSNDNSNDMTIVRCAVACGLYPMIGFPKKNKAVTRKGERVCLRGSSHVSKGSEKAKDSMLSRWGDHSMFAFDEIIRGDGGLYVRNTTMTGADGENDTEILCLDNWLRILIDRECAKDMCILRSRLAEAFAFKVSHPRAQFSPKMENTIKTLIDYFRIDAQSPAIDPEAMEVPCSEDQFPKSSQANYRGKAHPRPAHPGKSLREPLHHVTQSSHLRRGSDRQSRRFGGDEKYALVGAGTRDDRKPVLNHSSIDAHSGYGSRCAITTKTEDGRVDRRRVSDIPMQSAGVVTVPRVSRDVLVVSRKMLEDKKQSRGPIGQLGHQKRRERGGTGRNGYRGKPQP